MYFGQVSRLEALSRLHRLLFSLTKWGVKFFVNNFSSCNLLILEKLQVSTFLQHDEGI